MRARSASAIGWWPSELCFVASSCAARLSPRRRRTELLTRLSPAQPGATADQRHECEPGARREDAVPNRGHRPLRRREIAEAHPPADPLAGPVPVRNSFRGLAHDDCAVADT